ncbi:MAG: FecR domain-containing protein, partial [Verrucomicrobia bacterium]|nr:FecR domain-containing protein [Verrucomicrobiota bacterium]
MLTAWASPLTAATDHQGFARVNHVEGRAMFAKADGSWKLVERDMVLRAGDVLKTEANSKVALGLGYNDGIVTLSPNTELAFDKLTYQHVGMEVVCDTELNLRAGQIFGELKKLSPGSTYLVKTPRGVAAIRDGTYAISADGDVQAKGGTVIMALTMSDGTTKTFTVSDGKSLSVSANPAAPSVGNTSASQSQQMASVVTAAESHNTPPTVASTVAGGGVAGGGGQPPIVLPPLPPQPSDVTGTK